jgi:hypothetical protein
VIADKLGSQTFPCRPASTWPDDYGMKDRIIRISIPASDLGQIIDCLEVRRESWAKTAEWFQGTLDDPFFMIEECSHEEEALALVDTYSKILSSIRDALQSN